MTAKIEDEQTLGSKYSKQIKELQGRMEELDEELCIERQNRAKAEKNRSLLSRDIEDLRQKHNNNMSEMGEQIDSLNKMKAKADKDKAGMERDLQEARAGLDESMRDRANHERNGKLTGGLIVEANQKLDEMARALNEADSSRKKLQV